MTIRGGGNPTRNMALEPRFRVGPPPRSLAADAHGCIMVRPHRGPTGYKVVARRLAPPGRLPSDRRLRSSIGCTLPSWEVPRSLALDRQSPIQARAIAFGLGPAAKRLLLDPASRLSR